MQFNRQISESWMSLGFSMLLATLKLLWVLQALWKVCSFSTTTQPHTGIILSLQCLSLGGLCGVPGGSRDLFGKQWLFVTSGFSMKQGDHGFEGHLLLQRFCWHLHQEALCHRSGVF